MYSFECDLNVTPNRMYKFTFRGHDTAEKRHAADISLYRQNNPPKVFLDVS